MHFDTKSYLKSTRNHTVKHALNLDWLDNSGFGFYKNKKGLI
jgi:hypothetical protein